MEFEGEAVAGFGGFDFVVERAAAIRLAFVHDGDLIRVLSTRSDADESLLGTVLLAPVARVLPGRAETQIVAAVVQAVAVDVIDEHSLGGLHDFAVHEDEAAVLASLGVPRRVVGRGLDLPLVLVEPLVLGGVDDGVQATGQGDIAERVVGRVRRLDAEGPEPEVAAGFVGDRADQARGVGAIGAQAGNREAG